MLEELIKNIRSLPKKERYTVYGCAFITIVFSFYTYFHIPPEKFPLNDVITIEKGESLQNITNNLYEQNVIKFPTLFRSTVILLGGEKKVIAGDYLLDEKTGPIDIAHRLIAGNFHTEAKKITIPEGWNIYEIADFLEKSLVKFNKDEFIKLAKDKEGYLFPDTYFISNATRPKTLINLMSDTFEAKIKNINGFATTTRKFEEIITMASIIEGEANNLKDRQIISGILWKRIMAGMPLQVDATFEYVNGKGTHELTYDDLKIDSPYNTYVYKGLPPTPINNPGVEAIFAALHPVESKYLYFLTGRDGKMYYARTFEQHKLNKVKYLYN